MIIKRPYKIALIDDDESILEFLEITVNAIDGVTARAFSDPEQALKAIKEEQIRIVLTDVNMPNMPGDDLLRECMKLKQGVSVFVATGCEKMTIADRCMQIGARAVLSKPVTQKQIEEAVLEGCRHLDRWQDMIRQFSKASKKAA